MPDGWYQLQYQILSDGSLAVLGSSEDLNTAWKSDREGQTNGLFQRLLPKALGKIWMIVDGSLHEQVTMPLRYPFPLFDRFDGERWLLVNARSDGKGNARVLSKDGEELRTIELGDGIEHVQIDSLNRIWVGWFDEGIFGNDQWRVPGLRWPPSASGVAAFDAKGMMVSSANIDGIADCYAMNVFKDEVWTCTYTDFPIWTSSNGVEKIWDTDLSGTQAIAVFDQHVLAAGGYDKNAGKLKLLRLHESKDAQNLATWDLLESGLFEGSVEWLSARADVLYAHDGAAMYKWHVSQFLQRPL